MALRRLERLRRLQRRFNAHKARDRQRRLLRLRQIQIEAEERARQAEEHYRRVRFGQMRIEIAYALELMKVDVSENELCEVLGLESTFEITADPL